MEKKIVWLTALEDIDGQIEVEKGKTYYGEYDEDNSIWLLDEWWLIEISISGFDVGSHGSYVNSEDIKKFKLSEETK